MTKKKNEKKPKTDDKKPLEIEKESVELDDESLDEVAGGRPAASLNVTACVSCGCQTE